MAQEVGRKRVAIIGAGASGMLSIKCCLDEGLDPVSFERTAHLGGMWKYTDEVKEGNASVMKSTVINTSKEMMCFSTYPIPAEFPNFMHNTQLYKYFLMYAEHFKLQDYIQFNKEVVKVKQAPDYAQTGRWEVTVKDLKTNEVKTDTYDAVMVCTGHHAEKKMPNFPGEDEFQGEIVHTHDYRHHKGYEDKRVVVVGIGNSGLDVAVELSKISAQVYLSTRRGSWIANRVGFGGTPLDMVTIRRATQTLTELVPRWMKNSIMEGMFNSRFNHYDYGLAPAHRFDQTHVSINDELPNRIACGSIVIKPNIRRLTKTGVEFDDGTSVDNIDVVIYATGYLFGFPFVDHPALQVRDNQCTLYKYEWPPELEHSSLAVIGYFQPVGSINPISELQCRWATSVFKGAVKLPAKEVMLADIEKRRMDMAKRYTESTRHTIQVDWIPFMDAIAEEIGCKPDIRQLWFSDPCLAFQVVFGPCAPYQYRLHGPGAWPGAREAIMTLWQRTMAPMKTRKVPEPVNNRVFFWLLAIIMLAWFLRVFIDWIV